MLTARDTALSGVAKIQSIWHIHLHGEALMRITTEDDLRTLPAVAGTMVTTSWPCYVYLLDQLSFSVLSLLGRKKLTSSDSILSTDLCNSIGRGSWIT